MVLGFVSSCVTVEENQLSEEQMAENRRLAKEREEMDFMLGMRYEEAVMLSKEATRVPPFFGVCAERIMEKDSGEVMAWGRVFVEIAFEEPLRAFCQEARMNAREVTLEGMPVLRRGNSVLEATSPETVFHVSGSELKVEGPHRVREFGRNFE